MTQDKAIIKALKAESKTIKLSEEFNGLLLVRIQEMEIAKRKRDTIVGYLILFIVSIGLISLAVFIINYYYSFNMSLHLPVLVCNPISKNIFIFCSYIAGLVLILMLLDTYLRKWILKLMNNK